MRTFFHWNPEKLRRRERKLILVAAALCAEICVAAFFVLIFNVCTVPDRGVIFQTLSVICGALLAGLLFCLVTAAVCGRKIRLNSRYTYLDIQLQGLVYSAYAGQYRVAGERIVVRDLYYLPFRALSAVSAEADGKTILLTGKLRHYCMDSDNLGYHVRGGDFEFDRPYLNIGGFSEEERLRLPPVFGSTGRVLDSVNAAKKRWSELPAPKPHVFREADYIRLRPKARVLPESFDYNREWKI